MASICNRCALRLQRAAQSTSKRAFSQSATRSKQLPSFHETSNEDLNNVLATLRTQHIIPAYLTGAERKLIFTRKNKQYLEENPQTTEIGDEEIELQWLDKNARTPVSPLLKQALKMILQTKDNSWDNLPSLLTGIKETTGKPVGSDQMEWIVRKALKHGKLPIIFPCLQQGKYTGMTLTDWGVLRNLIFGIREKAQKSGWEKHHVANALQDYHKLAALLETETHGGGKFLRPNDERRRPEVLATVLELSAVYAYKHAGGEDVDDVVKTFTDRTLSMLEANLVKYLSEEFITLNERKAQWPFLLAVPIYHGLSLAQKILGDNTPRLDGAQQFTSQYQMILERLASKLEARNPAEGSYDAQALAAWKMCIRD